MSKRITLGIDVGGSGIKGAPVDLKKGAFVADREKIATPQPATPEAVGKVVVELIERFDEQLDKGSPVGVTMPSVIKDGVALSAANIDKSWIGTDADRLITDMSGHEITVVNDADAAGLAEVRFGAAKGQHGLVMVTTLGTGIGSALIYDGVLVPNSELGHLQMDGKDAEWVAAASAREKEGLSWADWATRLQSYYEMLERLFSPDLFVVGGGVSRKSEKFLPLLTLRTPIVPATLENQAGIIGAALVAQESSSQKLGSEKSGSEKSGKD